MFQEQCWEAQTWAWPDAQSPAHANAPLLCRGGLHSFAAFHLLLISHEQRTRTQRFSLNGHRNLGGVSISFPAATQLPLLRNVCRWAAGTLPVLPMPGAERSRCGGLPVCRPAIPCSPWERGSERVSPLRDLGKGLGTKNNFIPFNTGLQDRKKFKMIKQESPLRSYRATRISLRYCRSPQLHHLAVVVMPPASFTWPPSGLPSQCLAAGLGVSHRPGGDRISLPSPSSLDSGAPSPSPASPRSPFDRFPELAFPQMVFPAHGLLKTLQ